MSWTYLEKWGYLLILKAEFTLNLFNHQTILWLNLDQLETFFCIPESRLHKLSCEQGNQKRRNKSWINLFQDHTKRVCTFFRFTFLSFSCLCFSTDFNNLLRFVHEKYFIWKFLDLEECMHTYMHRENVRHFSSNFWALLCFFRFCSVSQSEWKMNFHSASSSSRETLSQYQMSVKQLLPKNRDVRNSRLLQELQKLE